MSSREHAESRGWCTWPACVACALLLAVVWAVFGATLSHEFTTYDERAQLIENPLVRDLSPRGLARMFSRFSITSYYPVRLLSLALDFRVWGLAPRGYHLTNVLVHGANVLLLFWLGLCLAGGSARCSPARTHGVLALCTLLFAVHPLVVEPVAWVGAREELLLVFFVLLSMQFYCRARRHRTRPGSLTGKRRTRLLYALSWVCAAPACMSSVLAVVLPVLILVIEYSRFLPAREEGAVARFRAVVARTSVFWALSVATIIVKKIGERLAARENIWVPELHMGVLERARTVLVTFWQNLRNVAWPNRLALIYPRESSEDLSVGVVALGLFCVVSGALVMRWALRKRGGALLACGWFLAALLPSAQIIPHHIFRADRFLYLPLAGLALGLGLAAAASYGRRFRVGMWLLAVAALAFGLRAHAQARVWRNGETVFTHSLSHYPACVDARNNLGIYLSEHNRYAEAARQFSAALTLNAEDVDAHYNMGRLLEQQGDASGAARRYRRALALRPTYVKAHNNLANLLRHDGAMDQALEHYRTAIRLQPGYSEAYNNLGLTLGLMGRETEAVVHLREAVRLNPGLTKAHINLGIALERLGSMREAVAHYLAAVEGAPDDPAPRLALAEALIRARLWDDAAVALAAAAELAPNSAQVQRLLQVVARHRAQSMQAGEAGWMKRD